MREFPPFRLDTVNQCLWRGDGAAEERVLLAPKAFDVLRYLVEHPGRLVAHDELLEALWPKTYVQPEVLKSHIAAIRAVLGDDTRKPMFIETMSRRGYRFVAPSRRARRQAARRRRVPRWFWSDERTRSPNFTSVSNGCRARANGRSFSSPGARHRQDRG